MRDVDAARLACAHLRNSARLCGCGAPSLTPPCRAAIAAVRDGWRPPAEPDRAAAPAAAETAAVPAADPARDEIEREVDRRIQARLAVIAAAHDGRREPADEPRHSGALLEVANA